MSENRNFLEQVRQIEVDLFPEFKDGNTNFEIHPNWVYFAPSWHIKAGLFSEEEIFNIVNEAKTVLSVGSGPAYLEQLIVYFGASIENVLLSDIDGNSMPKQFKTVVFDMFEDWNVLGGQKFDYIIFPESIFIFLKSFDKDDEAYYFASLMEKALIHLNPGGIARFSCGNKPPFLLEKAFNFLEMGGKKFEYTIFKNAFGISKKE